MSKKEKKWENVSINKNSLDQIDEMVKLGKFPSRANACNFMIRTYIEKKDIAVSEEDIEEIRAELAEIKKRYEELKEKSE